MLVQWELVEIEERKVLVRLGVPFELDIDRLEKRMKDISIGVEFADKLKIRRV